MRRREDRPDLTPEDLARRNSALSLAQSRGRRDKTTAAHYDDDDQPRVYRSGTSAPKRSPYQNVSPEEVRNHSRRDGDPPHSFTRSGLDGETASSASRRNNDVDGLYQSSHAEKKSTTTQSQEGTNNPTGVDRDMCGDCRRWHRTEAQREGRDVEVSDPNHHRTYRSDGEVDVYDRNGTYMGTADSGTDPVANTSTYENVPW